MMTDKEENKVDQDWQGTEVERCQCLRCSRVEVKYEDE